MFRRRRSPSRTTTRLPNRWLSQRWSRQRSIDDPDRKRRAERERRRDGDPKRALATVDEALATVERAGFRAFEAELHRVRGEILLKRDPSNPAPAEEALLTAIAIAKQQGTRSFELRAALCLAKLYCSMGRNADAHSVLGAALKGFAPTPDFPEVAEAVALLTTIPASARS